MDLSYESIAIEKAKKGNAEAWSLLFKLNFRPVYHLCLQLANKDGNDAEDIAQHTFIIAAQKISKFNPHKGDLRAWLYGIAKNCYKKHMATKGKHTCDSIDNSNIQSLAEPNNDRSEKILVLETLAGLPAKYRSLLEVKYLEKKTVNEIALDQNSTAKAIESRLTRAREQFKMLYLTLRKKESEI